jgi:hypothetical protein
MNRGFFADDFRFEFMQPQERGSNSVAEFLARFDAIFTLNQDILLETAYLTIEPKQSLSHRWSAVELPGMIQRVQPPPLLPRARWAGEWCPKPDVISVAPTNSHTQPVYKLHGSSNWVDETGARLLVMGGDKTTSIKGSKVLSLYMEEFEARLRAPDTRVMIIGYGFRDDHINGALNRAAAAGAKTFIVDPAGADAPDLFRDRVSRLKAAGDEKPIQKALVGASRRPLSRTFGGDAIERDKVLRFFDQ